MTGMARLDGLTGGFRAGQLIIVAGRPGKGKTALAMTWATDMASGTGKEYDEDLGCWIENEKHNCAVGVISLEMTYVELRIRQLAISSGFSGHRLTKRNLDYGEKEFIKGEINKHRKLPIYMNDSSPMNLNIVRSIARKWKRTKDIKILFIDYMQLIESETVKGQNREAEVGRICRGIKSLAKELEIPIVALAQLNRESAKTNAKPGLHNLRESGSLEQEAHAILLIHSEEEESVELAPGSEHKYSLILAKNRGGPCDIIPAIFKTHSGKFLETQN